MSAAPLILSGDSQTVISIVIAVWTIGICVYGLWIGRPR